MVNIYEKALQFIRIRPHHSQELRKKLLLRKYPLEEVQETISRLNEQGLLNDQVFGLSYLDSLKHNKTYGYFGIKAKLMSHGLASNEAENLLREGLSKDEEMEIGAKLVARERVIDKVRIAQKLARKGFRSEVISELLGRIGENMV